MSHGVPCKVDFLESGQRSGNNLLNRCRFTPKTEDASAKQMSAVTDQVNQLATSIAGYNNAIAVAAANGKAPNDQELAAALAELAEGGTR